MINADIHHCDQANVRTEQFDTFAVLRIEQKNCWATMFFPNIEAIRDFAHKILAATDG